MKTKTLKKWLLLSIGIFGISYYSIFTSENLVTYGKIIKPVKNISVSQKKIAVLPIRIKIPKIGVNAIIENVGITPKGTLDVPKGIKNAGLYKL
jgi:hypothetical protein